MPHANPHALSAALSALLLAASPAQAQYQCRQPDGATRFQQTPCQAGETETALKLPPRDPEPLAGEAERRRARLDDLDRRVALRAAIEAGRPAVGMSQAELELALGRAEEGHSQLLGTDRYEQLLFQRKGRTYTVSTQNGFVTAVQEREQRRRERRCASAREIRDLEIEISKIANRDNARLQADLQRRLAEARACR